MRLPIYIVHAFTDTLFGGNPAAVCPLTEWLPDDTMQQLAKENNLSETAFFVPEENGFRLRWFTPTVEVKPSLVTKKMRSYFTLSAVS